MNGWYTYHIMNYIYQILAAIIISLSSVQYFFHQPYIIQIYIIGNMFENIAYVGLGFAAVFLGLELAWHFTACKLHDQINKTLFLQASWLIEIERPDNNGKYRNKKN
jgi:hypothetical protein